MKDESICKVKGLKLSMEVVRDTERCPWREKGKCMKSKVDQRLVRCSQRCVTHRMSKEEGDLHSAQWYKP